MTFPGWKTFERHVTNLLGIDGTIHSGSKWYDPGDGVTRGRKSSFPLFADAKYTERNSMVLKLTTLLDLSERAADQGKRMIMPIRFWTRTGVGGDYVVMRLDDFAELMEMTHHGL